MTETTGDAFERLFRAQPLPVIVYDPDTRVIRFVNDAAVNHYGIPKRMLERSRIDDIDSEAYAASSAPEAVSPAPGTGSVNDADAALTESTLATNDISLAGRTYRMVVMDPVGHAGTAAEDYRRQLRSQQQQQSIAELDRDPAIADGRFPEALDTLLRSAAEALGVRRLGFWRLTDSPPGLRCERLYDRGHDRICGGAFLDGEQCPTYMGAVATSRVIDASDAMADARLVELREYLRSNRISSLLDAPIRLRGEVVGVLCHEHVGEARDWQEDEIRFAGEIADQLSQALLNAERRRYKELLRGMVSLVGPETGEAFYRSLVTNVARLLDATCVFVARLDPDDRDQLQTMAMAQDGALVTSMTMPVTYPLCAAPLREGVHVVSHDLAYLYGDQPWGSSHDGESYIGIRLEDRDGTVLGLLAAVGREPITEDEDTVALLRVFADRAGVELARLRREPHLLRAAAVLDNTSEGIAMARDDGQIVEANPSLADLTGTRTETLEQASLFDLISEPSPSRIHDAVASDGRWRGEVTVTSQGRPPFPAWLTLTRFAVDEIESGQTRIVALLSDISSVRESQAELEHLAHHDPLTGLPNRTLFHDRVEQAIQMADREGHRIALLFLDLDGFKDVNDSLGHSQGDQLLTAVAERLGSAMRESDTLARIGGDEFMVLFNGLTDDETAGTAAARLLDVFRTAFEVAGHEVFTTASAGISVYPRDGGSVETLIQHADAAMYDAKAAGKNTFRFFMPALTQNAFERVALVSAIRTALENDEFYLCFQSQIALADGQVTGCEALIRWRRPNGETVMPGEFIPLAERSGLITAIGQWVLEASCRQGRAWLDEGLEFGRVAVNVAATQISQSGFAEELLGILDRTGLPAERLSIEITESLFLEPHQAVERTLSVLRDAGVEIAIDDFGKGYSSLAYLKRLPIDTVKLDKSFTSDIPNDGDSISIAQAIVGLAGNLGLSVVAEGIENEEQQLFLETLRCARGQGFRYSHPVTASEFTALLRETAANAPV